MSKKPIKPEESGAGVVISQEIARILGIDVDKADILRLEKKLRDTPSGEIWEEEE